MYEYFVKEQDYNQCEAYFRYNTVIDFYQKINSKQAKVGDTEQKAGGQ